MKLAAGVIVFDLSLIRNHDSIVIFHDSIIAEASNSNYGAAAANGG